MRNEKGHKQATRRRIVETASKRFRRDGIEAVGVAGLMGDSGLTHGGFYAHFPSKEVLVQEAVAGALDESIAVLAKLANADGGGLKAIIGAYLGSWHRDRPEFGCASAALASELARHPQSTRAIFAERVEALTDLIARHLPIADEQLRRQRATAILGVMMGTLQLARATADKARSAEILKSGADAAFALGGAA